MRCYVALVLLLGSVSTVHAYSMSDLKGKWCFYQQSALGNTVSESISITLNADGTYRWDDKVWKQTGTWTVKDGKLKMTNVGSHKLISVTPNHITMERYSIMKMKKGLCIR